MLLPTSGPPSPGPPLWPPETLGMLQERITKLFCNYQFLSFSYKLHTLEAKVQTAWLHSVCWAPRKVNDIGHRAAFTSATTRWTGEGRTTRRPRSTVSPLGLKRATSGTPAWISLTTGGRQMPRKAMLLINLAGTTSGLLKMEYAPKGLLLLNHNTNCPSWLIVS